MATLATMPKYEAYKDSGVGWLGEIPKHWEVKRLAVFGAFSKGGGFSKSDLTEKGVSAVLYGDIYTKYEYVIDCVERNISSLAADKSVTIVRGDLLFTGSGETKEDIGKCVVYNGNDEAKAGGDIIIFKQKDNNTLFLSYCLNTHGVMEEKAKSSKGEIIVHTYASKLKNLYISIPPQLEQTIIANYLDKKTTQINEAIAIKEKQIILLKERKQIIIQKAVTQGLNTNVPMKDSGVDWIGKIPEHWEVKRAKYLFKEIDERSISGNEELLSVSHLTGVTPRSEKSVTMIAEDYTGSKTCQENDLIMNIMWAWMGALGVSDRVGIVSSAYSIYRQISLHTFNPIYLEWLLKTTGYIEHYNKVSTGLHSSRLRFYSRMFFDMEIGFPERKEQNKLVEHVEEQSLKIDNAIELQGLQIEKLKEYKTTLINSAVTGKIKIEGNGNDA